MDKVVLVCSRRIKIKWYIYQVLSVFPGDIINIVSKYLLARDSKFRFNNIFRKKETVIIEILFWLMKVYFDMLITLMF